MYGATSTGGTAEFNGGTFFRLTPAGKLTIMASLDLAFNGPLLQAPDGFIYTANGANVVRVKLSQPNTVGQFSKFHNPNFYGLNG